MNATYARTAAAFFTTSFAASLAAFVGAACVATAATAAEPAQATAACTAPHPALSRSTACVQTAGIDANTFIVMPPATTRWLAQADADGAPTTVASAPHVRANYAHPALAVARMQRTAGVDANTFIVQPPVAVSWTVMPQDTVFAAVPGKAPLTR